MLSMDSIDKVSKYCNIGVMEQLDLQQLENDARLLRVLGHPMRLAMVEALRERPWCVCELAGALGLHKSAASKHLSLLKSVGVIDMDRDGTQVNCTLTMPCVVDMIRCTNQDNRSVGTDGVPKAQPACNSGCCSPRKEKS